MSKTRIFVSSTCYDLAALRESIKDSLTALGHEPILSEYSSFPIFPDLTAVDNCKKVVREHTDILLLIVGGKRGSLDSPSGQPIVNLEYKCAVEQGLEVFVFVKKPILDLMPLWEKNPSSDFMPHVDFPEVFSFVQKLKENNRWIFCFDQIADIKTVISTQLSVLLRELLSRKRTGKLKYLNEFLEESECAQELAREKPSYWEYLLVEELLRRKLEDVNRRYSDLKRGLIFRKMCTLDFTQTLEWMHNKVEDYINIAQLFTVAIPEEISPACGRVGEAGDAVKIKQSIDSVIQGCLALLEWETDVAFVTVPERLRGLKGLMAGSTRILIDEVNRVPQEISRLFKGPSNPRGLIEINLTFKSPPNLNLMREELAKIVVSERCRA